MRARPRLRLPTACAVGLLVACASSPGPAASHATSWRKARGYTLALAPPRGGAPIDVHVWIRPVQIAEPDFEEGAREAIAQGLCFSFRDYLRERQAFRSVDLLPGKIADDDLVLGLVVDRYLTSRVGSFLDSTWLIGWLRLEDAQGRVLTEAHANVHQYRGGSPFETSLDAPSGAEVRTQFVEQLVDQVLPVARRATGARP